MAKQDKVLGTSAVTTTTFTLPRAFSGLWGEVTHLRMKGSLSSCTADAEVAINIWWKISVEKRAL